MDDHFFALLIEEDSQLLEPLKTTLNEMTVQSVSLQTTEEAGKLLAQVEPLLAFTAIPLSDGSWSDMMNQVEKAGVLADVIVLAPTTDIRLYLSAMERGAFDFVAPPAKKQSLSHIVKSVKLDGSRRKAALLRVAVA